VTVTTTPGSVIDLDGAANCRDLGGWAVTGGGIVRHGLVLRSTELHGLTDAGVAQLAALGLHTVYDLRTTAERDAQPDRLPGGVHDVHLDVLADDPANAAAGAADLPALLADPAALGSLLAGTSFAALFADAYRGVVSLPSAIASYRTMFTGIADAEQRPSLFHCTTGKDRTGWGAAALLTFLGVGHDDVVAEYLLTNSEILPLTQPMYDAFAAAGGDPDLLRPALGVDAAYLDTAFEEMASRFGTIERYFSQGLGLDDATLDSLRSALIDDSGPSAA
jgi:protein-tyrosine phosphatase